MLYSPMLSAETAACSHLRQLLPKRNCMLSGGPVGNSSPFTFWSNVENPFGPPLSDRVTVIATAADRRNGGFSDENNKSFPENLVFHAFSIGGSHSLHR